MQRENWKFALIAALAVGSVPGIAAADDAMGESRGYTPIGAYFLAGGGVSDFANEALRDSFKVGGAWDLRLGIGSRYFLGGELAYVGSARGGDGVGYNLLSNGGEAVVRVQYPAKVSGWLIEPFAFGGIGFNRLTFLDDSTNRDGQSIGTIPFGAGVMAGYRHMLIDARFTYRPAFGDSEVVLARTGVQENLHSWAVMASVGYEF